MIKATEWRGCIFLQVFDLWNFARLLLKQDFMPVLLIIMTTFAQCPTKVGLRQFNHTSAMVTVVLWSNPLHIRVAIILHLPTLGLQVDTVTNLNSSVYVHFIGRVI